MNSRFYPGVVADVPQLMAELHKLFAGDEAYEVQTMQVASTAVLQARKSSTLRDLTGLSAALTIKVTPEHGRRVEKRARLGTDAEKERRGRNLLTSSRVFLF